MKPTIYFLLSCLCTLNLLAQPTNITNYINKNDMKAFVQEGNYLWTAADGGILKWDLSDMTYEQWSTAEGLVSNVVHTVFMDSEQNKWFGTDKGIQILNADGSWSYVTTADGLPHHEVTKIEIDNLGNRWFAHKYSGASVWRADGTWATYTTAEGLADGRVNAITFDTDGNTWLGTGWEGGGGGASKIDVAGNVTTYTTAQGFSSSVRAIEQDLEGIIWFASHYEGLIRLHPDGEWDIWTNDPPVWVRIGAMVIGEDNTRYLGQSILNAGIGGLVIIGADDVATIYDNFGEMSAVSDMLLADEHTLWLSTAMTSNSNIARGGLVNFDTTTEVYTRFEQGNTVLSNDISHVVTDDLGSLYMSSNRGLNILDAAGNWTAYGFGSGIHGQVVTHSYTDASGNIWLGLYGGSANGGLNQIASDGTMTSYNTLNSDIFSDRVTAMYVDDEERVWLGAEHCGGCFTNPEGGISVLDTEGNWTIYRVSDGLVGENVTFITQDSEGRMWILTEEGISVFEDGVFTNTPLAYHFRQMDFDSEGTAWLVAGNDPWLMPNGALISIDATGALTIHPFPQDLPQSYHCIVIDAADNKWLGTTQSGIFKLNPSGNYTQMTTADGLAADEIHDLELVDNTTLWAATVKGVSEIDVSSVTAIESPNLQATSSVLVYPNPFKTQATVELPEAMAGVFSLYDVMGRKVFEQVFSTQQTVLNLDRKGLNSGVYFYEMQHSNGTHAASGKVVVE